MPVAISWAGGASADGINCGSGSSITNLAEFTYYTLFYPQAFDTDQVGLIGHGDFPGDDRRELYWATGASAVIQCHVDRATTDANAISSTTYSLNAWLHAFGTFEATDGPRLFAGALNALITEASYSTRDVGSGALGDDSDKNLFVGNAGYAGGNLEGRIAIAAVYSRQMGLVEMQIVARGYLFRPGLVGLWFPGRTGTTSVQDLSGNGNTGTITGGSLADGPAVRTALERRKRAISFAAAAGLSIPVAMHNYRRRRTA